MKRPDYGSIEKLHWKTLVQYQYKGKSSKNLSHLCIKYANLESEFPITRAIETEADTLLWKMAQRKGPWISHLPFYLHCRAYAWKTLD